jgi:hypothetical protein
MTDYSPLKRRPTLEWRHLVVPDHNGRILVVCPKRGIRPDVRSGRISQTHAGREWVLAGTLKPTPAERGFSAGSDQKSGGRTSERGEKEIAGDGGPEAWLSPRLSGVLCFFLWV